MSTIFDVFWSLLLIGGSRVVAGRLLAVPVRLHTALTSSLLGVTAIGRHHN